MISKHRLPCWAIRLRCCSRRYRREEIKGIRLNNEWRLSVFVLAGLLSASPETLLDYLKDRLLAEKIAEVEGDEFFEPGEGRQVYQSYLAEAS